MTEALSDFRKAAEQASAAELDRFVELSAHEGWRPVAKLREEPLTETISLQPVELPA